MSEYKEHRGMTREQINSSIKTNREQIEALKEKARKTESEEEIEKILDKIRDLSAAIQRLENSTPIDD